MLEKSIHGKTMDSPPRLYWSFFEGVVSVKADTPPCDKFLHSLFEEFPHSLLGELSHLEELIFLRVSKSWLFGEQYAPVAR